MNTTQNFGGMSHTLEGRFRAMVVDANTGEVVLEQPEFTKNLILNNGMDGIASRTYANSFLYAMGGVGTRPNSIVGATAQVSQSYYGLTLYPDGTFTGFTDPYLAYYPQNLELGDVIVFDSVPPGTTDHVQVTTAITALTATCSLSQSIPPTTFTVWKTSQTSLESEVSRSTSYLTGTGNCGSSILSDTLTLRRTYDFPTETSARNYTEIGVGWSGTRLAPNTTFSRLRLPVVIPVGISQLLRVVFQLQVKLAPTSSVSRPNVVINGVGGAANWPIAPATNTNGSESMQAIWSNPTQDGYAYGTIQNIYNTGQSSGFYSLEPSGDGQFCYFWLSEDSQTLRPFNTAVSRGNWNTQTTKNAYVNGTYTVRKTGVFSIAQANSLKLRSMGIGQGSVNPNNYDPGSADYQGFTFLFEQSQSKYSSQTLTLAYSWTWDRSFVE